MTFKSLAIAAIAASCLSFSAVAAEGPGVGGKKGSDGATISDLGPLSLVDNYGDTYNLSATVTGSRPISGTISGRAVACSGSGSYEASGSFLGTTVHLNLFLTSGGACQSFVVDCVVNGPTKTCVGTFTNADGSSGPITISRP